VFKLLVKFESTVKCKKLLSRTSVKCYFTEVRTPVKCKLSVVCEYSVSGTQADIVKALRQCINYINMWPKILDYDIDKMKC
jgi:hypothetical protein